MRHRPLHQNSPSVAAIWPGKGAVLWPECQRASLIRVGWDWFRSDLSRFENFEDFKGAYRKAFETREKLNDTFDIPLNLWQFYHLKPGDIVLALGKRKLVLALGRVTGPYIFMPELKEYRHALPVEWNSEINFELPTGIQPFDRKAFTLVPQERFELFLQALRDQAYQVMQSRLDAEPSFDFSALRNDQERRLAALCLRQGQSAFRAELLRRFQGRCPITGCDAEAALEAAHIVSYAEGGTGSSDARNGLLLRSDIHALFDRGLLGIDTQTLRLQVHASLTATVYGRLEGQELALPNDFPAEPLRVALRERDRRNRLT